MAKSKGFNLADVIKNVPKLDTGDGRKQIEYIDIDLLDDDPKNFYDLSDLDDLANNIATVGLQQPLVVRPNPDAPGRFIIVSGHRRRAAVRKLTEEGRADLRQIPCLRESGEGSPAMQELRLIFANSGTRRLTSAEISTQAERVEMLLYQLKEEGYEFPGRMRDYVAEACKVSKSKLARLKVIRENLVPELKKDWEKGEMNESVAYACAQQTPSLQRQLITFSKKWSYCSAPKYWSESLVNDRMAMLRAEATIKCPKQTGRGCCNSKLRLTLRASSGSQYVDNCREGKCCSGCPRIGSCKYACSMLSAEIAKAKAAAKAKRAREKEEQAKKDRPVLDALTEWWRRFAQARAQAEISIERLYKATDLYYYKGYEAEILEREQGKKLTPQSDPPKVYGIHSWEMTRLIKVADALGCSLDYLFCRTDVPDVAKKTSAPLAYITDRTPTEAGMEDGTEAIVLFKQTGCAPFRLFGAWRNGQWTSHHEPLEKGRVLGWYPLPKTPDESELAKEANDDDEA